MSISKNKEMTLIIGSAVISMFALAGTAFAATNPGGPSANAMNFARPGGYRNSVGGKWRHSYCRIKHIGMNAEALHQQVNNITTQQLTAATTYTVDATNATVTKNNAASTSPVSRLAIL